MTQRSHTCCWHFQTLDPVLHKDNRLTGRTGTPTAPGMFSEILYWLLRGEDSPAGNELNRSDYAAREGRRMEENLKKRTLYQTEFISSVVDFFFFISQKEGVPGILIFWFSYLNFAETLVCRKPPGCNQTQILKYKWHILCLFPSSIADSSISAFIFNFLSSLLSHSWTSLIYTSQVWITESECRLTAASQFWLGE